jgi:mono/diheme cytochrome c family protein
MTWFAPTGATIVATVVPAGVALAAALAWLMTVLNPGDPVKFPGAQRVGTVDPAQLERNLDPVALEQGRVYYAQLCMSCHGVRGDGLGEWSYRVAPRPANLARERTRRLSDAQLYEIISEGLPGTAMIGWKRQLSEAQRRQVVVYVRHLGRGSGRSASRE